MDEALRRSVAGRSRAELASKLSGSWSALPIYWKRR